MDFRKKRIIVFDLQYDLTHTYYSGQFICKLYEVVKNKNIVIKKIETCCHNTEVRVILQCKKVDVPQIVNEILKYCPYIQIKKII